MEMDECRQTHEDGGIGWMYSWMDVWLDLCVVGRMDVWLDRYVVEWMCGWMSEWMDKWMTWTVASPDWFPAWRRPLWLARVSNLTTLGRPPRVIHTPMTCVALLPVLCFSLAPSSWSATTIRRLSSTRTYMQTSPPLLKRAFHNRSASILSGRPLTTSCPIIVNTTLAAHSPAFPNAPAFPLTGIMSHPLHMVELETSCAVQLFLFEDIFG